MADGWAFALSGAGSSTISIDIFDTIGEGMFFEGVTAKAVRAELKENPNADEIRVRINSKGGDVLDGLAIHNMLAEHSAKVVVDVDGIAASMASVIAMAGDEIRMASGSFMMIHNPRMALMGDADDLRKSANVLEKMRDTLVDIYRGQTGQTAKALIDMMNAETWLKASEAKALGFATKVTPAKKKQKAAAALAFASLEPDDYSNLPPELGALAHLATVRAHNVPGAPPVSGARYRWADDGITLELLPGNATIDAKDNPMTIPSSILATLRLPDDASEATVCKAIDQWQTAVSDVNADLRTLHEAIGETGEAAVGVVAAWKVSHKSLATAEAELAEVRAKASAAELAALLKAGRDDLKLTKAEADNIQAQVEAKEMTLAAAIAFVSVMAPKPHLSADPEPSTAQVNTDGVAAPTHNGKRFEEMKPKEWAALNSAAPELYKSMRADAYERNAI